MKDQRETMRSYFQKADLTVADMTTNGGALSAEQTKEFYQIALNDTVLSKEVTAKPMGAKEMEISTIGFTSRISRAGVEGQALSAADRAAPTTGKVTLSAKTIKFEVDLTEEDLEESIEGNNLQQTIMSLLAQRYAVDLEDLMINGNTSSTDPFLKLTNGVLALATSHPVDAGVAAFAETQLLALMKALPNQFKKDKSKLRFFTSSDAELAWRTLMAARATALGDSAKVSAAPIPAYGVQVVGVPLFPINLGVGTNETNTLLCDPKNIILGLYKTLKVKSQEDIVDGKYKVVGRSRVAINYQYEPAVAKHVKQTA